jgi:3-oxoacyl-[acyl-carrier-protein] synthase II
MNRRVVITGLGVVSPLGLTVEDFWQGLINGKSGIGTITLFDASAYSVKIAAEVKGFDPNNYMPPKRIDRAARCTQFAIAATGMALKSANLDMSVEKPEEVGVVMASSGAMTMLMDQGEILKKYGPKRLDPLIIPKITPSMVSAQVGLVFGAKGPNTSINSACASGSDSIGTALNHMLMGHAEVMICGGAESQVDPFGIASTSMVGALSKNPDPQKASRPFDADRGGFILGEGAGILILESYEHAKARGATILAELAGAGWSFDAYSETAPDAEQQAEAMKNALKEANVSPEEVDYINAHGTGTKQNDTAETKAIKMVFGERAYKIPISSNKSMIGHLACAAGSIEAVAAVMTIVNGIIPPTMNYETPDPNCDLDYVPNKARHQPVNVCLSNSFGMGGQNCSLIIKRFA